MSKAKTLVAPPPTVIDDTNLSRAWARLLLQVRHHPVWRAEPGPDRLRLGGGFHDHDIPAAALRSAATALQSPPPASGHGPAFRAADPPGEFAGPRMGPRRLAT